MDGIYRYRHKLCIGGKIGGGGVERERFLFLFSVDKFRWRAVEKDTSRVSTMRHVFLYRDKTLFRFGTAVTSQIIPKISL